MGIRPTEFIQSFFKYLKKSEMEPAPLGRFLLFMALSCRLLVGFKPTSLAFSMQSRISLVIRNSQLLTHLPVYQSPNA